MATPLSSVSAVPASGTIRPKVVVADIDFLATGIIIGIGDDNAHDTLCEGIDFSDRLESISVNVILILAPWGASTAGAVRDETAARLACAVTAATATTACGDDDQSEEGKYERGCALDPLLDHRRSPKSISSTEAQ